MAYYRVEFKRSVKKDLKQLPKSDVVGILNKIEALTENPRPPQSKKLIGLDLYRLKVGRYRILYEIKDQILIITIIKIAHRKDVYH
ncbi:MAG: type II toxin-antitoxin system RelE/ParE family toxin [Candidatus Marinimicrobia bacterium]|nr:type II toxin-antitoxin system RelE/ParE family toxin [Candidatus Neomarinimicrobiota bacterium]